VLEEGGSGGIGEGCDEGFEKCHLYFPSFRIYGADLRGKERENEIRSVKM
jgi:hypothetical protein